jgi:hypothetical protein
MVRKAALIFGAVLLAVGLLGFVPGIAPNGHLLGVFEVDTLHNLVHVATGLAGVGAYLAGGRSSKVYFQVFAVIYGVVTVLGFVQGERVLGLLPVNVADDVLHLVITAIALYLGFVAPDETVTTDSTRIAS